MNLSRYTWLPCVLLMLVVAVSTARAQSANDALFAAVAVDDGLVRRGPTTLTRLMPAAEAGVSDVVDILLGGGADPDAHNGGRCTAPDYAGDRVPVWATTSPADRAAVVKNLLAAGAKTDRAGADGIRPLARARNGRNVAIVTLLEAAGAK